MPTELVVHAVHQGGMKFAAAMGEHSLVLDYPYPPGHSAEGPTPLQMILTSLAVCSGSTLALLLENMGQAVEGLRVEARGLRRDDHPTVLTEIALEFVLRGEGLEPETVRQAIAMAEERLCPVWSMLKAGTPISATFRLAKD